MDEKELRSFLVQTPRPVKILVRSEGDDVNEVAPPAKGKGGSSWTYVARSILALEPVSVEVFDERGALIRATRLTETTPTPSAEAGLPVLHNDPETARLTHFANLLYRATEFSTNLAFGKMVELFQLTIERSIALEARLERAETAYRREMQDRINDMFDQAQAAKEEAEASQNDPVSQLAQAFMGGAQSAAAEVPNGKARG